MMMMMMMIFNSARAMDDIFVVLYFILCQCQWSKSVPSFCVELRVGCYTFDFGVDVHFTFIILEKVSGRVNLVLHQNSAKSFGASEGQQKKFVTETPR